MDRGHEAKRDRVAAPRRDVTGEDVPAGTARFDVAGGAVQKERVERRAHLLAGAGLLAKLAGDMAPGVAVHGDQRRRNPGMPAS